MLKNLTLLSLLSLSTLFANGIKPIFEIALTGGGTELVTIKHDKLNDYSISAGDGVSYNVGAVFEREKMDLQLFLGYKRDEDSASNGDISWSSIPLSLLSIYKLKNWKMGGGLTYHIRPKLSGSFGETSIEDSYQSALGAVIKIQYRLSESIDFGLNGTLIEYKREEDGDVAKGDNIGLVLTYSF